MPSPSQRSAARSPCGLAPAPASPRSPPSSSPILGSGYRFNVVELRPDRSSFIAPAFLAGPAAAFGLRAALTPRLFVSGSGGLAMLETSGHPGRFLDADVSLALGSRLAMVGGVRQMWYHDPHALLNRTFTPVVVGLRIMSGR